MYDNPVKIYFIKHLYKTAVNNSRILKFPVILFSLCTNYNKT